MSKARDPIEELLIKKGVHVGSRSLTKDMERFFYMRSRSGFYLIDVQKTKERLRLAARFLAHYEPSSVVVASMRLYGKTPVKKFCEVTGFVPIVERFVPGTFTNPQLACYMEPEAVVVTDPKADHQIVVEAAIARLPIVAFCNTDNTLEYIDLAIPANNRGREQLATIYWLLATFVLIERGELPPDGSLEIPIEEFEYKPEEV